MLNVSDITGWKVPGCSSACVPRKHDPEAHRAAGFDQAVPLLLALLACPVEPVRVVRTGPLEIDLEAARVTIDGEPVHLSNREGEVLAYLARRAGRLCPYEDILRDVWGPEWVTGRRHRRPDGQTVNVDRQSVKTNVNRLRGRLGDARDLIVTVTGHGGGGYRLELVPPMPADSEVPPCER